MDLIDCMGEEEYRRNMSLTRVKRLLSGLRAHHLGFCFFWAVVLSLLSGFQSPGEPLARLFMITEQVVTALTVGILALCFARRSDVLASRFSFVAGFLLCGGALLYYLAFSFGHAGVLVVVCSGLMIGCANALFFLLWQTFFVTEGQQRALIYIPVSAMLSVLIYLVTLILPAPARVFAIVVVLPFCAFCTLSMSLDEIEPYAIRVSDKTLLKEAVGDLWRPVFCVCAIGFVWKLVSQLSAPAGAADGLSGAVVLAGFGLAAVVVAGIELFSPKGFGIMRLYQVLFPLVTAIFLLPTFFGAKYQPVLVGMLMFGFESVNLLLLITCAAYTARHKASPLMMYGLCVFPVLACMTAGDMLGSALGPILSFDFAYVINVLFVCIYLLSLVLLLVSRGRQGQDTSAVRAAQEPGALAAGVDATPTPTGAWADESPGSAGAEQRMRRKATQETTPDAESLSEAIEALFADRRLSPREIEVTQLALKGNSVAAISRKLFISENTTRGHMKAIYRKLEVHSRQELVDLIEERSAS